MLQDNRQPLTDDVKEISETDDDCCARRQAARYLKGRETDSAAHRAQRDEGLTTTWFADRSAPSKTNLPRRCVFYIIAREFILIKIIPVPKGDNGTCVKVRQAITVILGMEIRCSRCGCKMHKDGYTSYEKTVYCLASSETQCFALQRLVCSNKNCPGKTKNGNNETHVLLPSDCVPKSEHKACELEDAQKTLSFLEKMLGHSLTPKSFFRNRKAIEALGHSERFLVNMSHRYGSHYRNYFLRGLVFSKRGMRLCRSIEILGRAASALRQCAAANGAARDRPEPSNLSGILVSICSESVGSLSTLHKISLPFMTDRIRLCSPKEPP